MENLWQDIKYGVRMLTSRPGVTGIAVIALALGIGATTAIFSSVNALLLQPLPFRDLDTLCMVWETRPNMGSGRYLTSPANFLDWSRQGKLFKQAAAFRRWSANLTGAGDPERLRGYHVSPSFFPTLDVKALLGRTFLPDEGKPGHDGVVVLSYGFWQRRFGGDDQVVGSKLRLNDRQMIVIGVVPEECDFPLGTDLWAPLALTPKEINRRDVHNLRVLARLRSGVSIREAQAEMNTLAAQLARYYPETNSSRGVRLILLREDINFGTDRFVLMLMGAAGFLLLLACANVANLQLALGTLRRKEIALRLALGASRSRVIQQLLSESLLLSLMGSAFGLLLAILGMDLMRETVPPDIAKYVLAGLKNLRMDRYVLGFTLATALVSAIAIGLLPALQSSNLRLTDSLREGGRSAPSGLGGRRARTFLVITEVALSIVLLIGAGLMVKGFDHLSDVDRGFEVKNLLTMRISLPESKYREQHRITNFYRQILRRLETIPQTRSIAAVNHLPSVGGRSSSAFTVEDQRPTSVDETYRADIQIISESYFQTMQIPLARGRKFTRLDGSDGQPTAIVSAALVRRYNLDEEPLGRQIKLGPLESDSPWRSIVGVVDDVSRDWIHNEPASLIYLPYAQSPALSMSLVLRAEADPRDLVPAIRSRIRSVSIDQPIYDVRTMEKILSDYASGVRASAGMMSAMAAVAFFLCAAGIYAIIAHSVTQRTHEIGVRMALGGGRRDVLKLFIIQGLRLGLLGIAVGLPVAFLLTRLISSLLFGVIGIHSGTFVTLTIVVLAVAALSSYIPARRATDVDPMIALRSE